jgi:hypothetical protein
MAEAKDSSNNGMLNIPATTREVEIPIVGGERKMKLSTLSVCVLIALTVESIPVEQQLEFRWTNAPLRVVLDHYAELSGKSVEVVKGVDAKVTMSSEEPILESEMLKVIEDKLRDLDIGLYPITDDRLVAAWINPPQNPRDTMSEKERRTYYEMRKLRESRRQKLRRQKYMETLAGADTPLTVIDPSNSSNNSPDQIPGNDTGN